MHISFKMQLIYLVYVLYITSTHVFMHVSIPRLTISVVVLWRAGQQRRHALPAVGRRIDIARARGPPLPQIHTIIHVLPKHTLLRESKVLLITLFQYGAYLSLFYISELILG